VRMLRNPAIWCLLLAGLVRTVLFIPDLTPDSWRFIFQAKSLLAGEGFLTFALQPCTSLPPGYPVFLALVHLISLARFDVWILFTWILQLLMSLASCYLVCAAVRPKAPRAAVGAFLLMAVSPMLARLAGYILSETFSTFLASLLVLAVSRLETRGSNLFHSFFLGFLCVGLLLTAPATIVLAFLIWCYVAWSNRKSPTDLAALIVGSLILMIPWQIHCYRATGKLQPTVYTSLTGHPSGFKLWCCTWVSTQYDMGVWWHPEQFRTLPDSLFSSTKQREELTALYYKEGSARLQDPQVSEPFHAAALQRINENPWRFYLMLPTRRAFSLWFDIEYGWSKAIQQLHRFSITDGIPSGHSTLQVAIRNIIGIAGILAYNGVHLALLLIVVLGLFSRKLMPWLIVSSAAIYTVISAVTAMGEFRRDLPFYPAVLFILYYLGPPPLPNNASNKSRSSR
jgi:hypothetical protein